MPGKRIPQNKLLRRQLQAQQRAPYNGRCGLGKTIRTFLRFACAPRCDAGKNFVRLKPAIFLFSEQDSLGGHGDTCKMTTAISKCFTDHYESRFAEPFAKISA